MMWMKPQDHPVQPAEPAEYSKYRRCLRYTLWRAYGFVILDQESWMIKTSTGSQEVQQLYQTEAIFQHEKTILRV